MLLFATSAFAAAPPEKPAPIPVAVPSRTEPVSYATEIADILDARCTGCHNGGLAESKLNLENVAGMLKGGKRGPALVAGKADESLLFQLAAHRAEPAMPPKNKKDQTPLTPEELGLLKLWIDAGAKDDSEAAPPESKPIELGALPPGVHPIVAVDMTGDGTRVAAGRANVVQVYDVDSGLEIIALGGHKDIIQSLRFTPDARLLAAGSYQIVTVWNAPAGGLKAKYAGHDNQVKAVVALPDDAGVISAGLDKTVRFWDPAGKPTRQLRTVAPVLALALARDGKTLALGGADHIVRIVDAAGGKERLALAGHAGPVTGVAFLGEGKRVASVSADGTGRVWTLPAAETDPLVLAPAGDATPLRAIAARPDGQRIAAAGDAGTIHIWDAESGRSIAAIDSTGTPVLALAWSPDGAQILAGCGDGSARLFEADEGRLLQHPAGHPGPVGAVAFSPDGQRIATAGAGGGVKVWETASGQGVIAFGHTAPKQEDKDPNAAIPPIEAVAWTTAGTFVTASADTTLKRWAFEGTWSERKPLGPHVFRVLSLDFNPDGTLLAAGGGAPSRSGELKLWEVGKGMLVRSLDALHSDTIFGVRFSPDGTRLASAAADRFLKVTRVADGKELKAFEGHTHHVLAVDWKSDGTQLASGGGDNVIKVWDFAAGEQLKTLPPAGKQVTALRWVPGNGTPGIVGAAGDKLVRLWNPDSGQNGQIVRSFSGPSDYVFGVAVANDGNRIAAGGADGVLFVWNAQNGQVLRKIDPRTEPAAAAQPPHTQRGP